MTLDELHEHLARLEHLSGDTPVILSRDAEGNRFSPAADCEQAMYAAETTWSGERYMSEEQRLAQDDPDEYFRAPDNAVTAVFLWPVN